jgi:hypothetical protein
VVEVAFCLLALIAGRMGRPNEPVLFSRIWGYFHNPPDAISAWCMHLIMWQNIQSAGAEVTRSVIFLLLAVLQWYFVLLIGIGLYRHFSRTKATRFFDGGESDLKRIDETKKLVWRESPQFR